MVLQKLYQTNQSVFNLNDLAILFNEKNYSRLKSKVAYYIKKWYLIRIRNWIFVKENFDLKELACKIYTPSYISFETVLQKNSVIFQYDSTLYLASYLSRYLEIPYKDQIIKIQYRKLKDDILFDQTWIIKKDFYWEATSKRAIKDMRYLQPDFYFDNIKNGSKGT